MPKAVLSNTYTKPERAMYLTGLLGQNIIYNVIATGMAYEITNKEQSRILAALNARRNGEAAAKADLQGEQS